MSSSSSVRALGAAALVAFCAPALAVEDLRALEVVGQRGQSLEQTRRDRYECHNWSVAETGEAPLATPADDLEPQDADRDRRRERIDRTIAGAVIGAGIGSLFGHGYRRDAGERVLAGAAVGAAIGAATANGREREVDAAADAEAAEPSDYLRALIACLEGRGYSVHLPTNAELTASR
jgi:uncharacterized protein YcfJ